MHWWNWARSTSLGSQRMRPCKYWLFTNMLSLLCRLHFWPLLFRYIVELALPTAPPQPTSERKEAFHPKMLRSRCAEWKVVIRSAPGRSLCSSYSSNSYFLTIPYFDSCRSDSLTAPFGLFSNARRSSKTNCKWVRLVASTWDKGCIWQHIYVA